MDIKNLSELGKIAALCRKKGIESIKISSDGGVEFKLTPLYPKPRKVASPLNQDKEQLGTLSEEDILFWSSAGVHSDSQGAN